MDPRSLDTLSIDVLVAAWNGVYSDYAVPMTRDADQLRTHVETGSIDDRLSLLWLDGDDPVGFSLLGVRGDRGWVGGFGVVPAHRGAGLATRMMREHLDLAADAGLTSVGLEVLADNPARHLYERSGFETTRLLHVLDGPLRGSATADTWSDHLTPAYAARLDALLATPAPWGRQGSCLPIGATVVAAGPLDAPTALAVLRQGSRAWSVLAAAAASSADAAALVGRLAAEVDGGAVRIVNEPEGSPLLDAFEAAGAQRTLVQHEMSVALPPSS